MDLKRCPNGHFYDGEKFPSCPHCAGGAPAGGGNVTVPFNEMGGGAQRGDMETVTMPADGIPTPPSPPIPVAPKPVPTDDAKTIGFFGVVPGAAGEAAVEPVVGWLVCTEGKRRGQEYRLKAGRNFIGRSPNMDVALEGETSVSREGHAIVAYEPRQSIFIAQPGSASELFYLNGNVVLSAVQIKRNDRLQLGDVELMLIPCCDENFKWEKKAE